MIKSILFNTEMVRAILDDRKTVTRRVVKPQPEITPIPTFGGSYRVRMKENVFVKPPYSPGDILYVRETWANISDWTNVDPEVGLFDGYIYKADWEDGTEHPQWHPSIHMPREAARIFLRVTDVRVERLQHLGIEEALKEGITPTNRPGGCRCRFAFDGCMEEPCSNRAAYEIERHVEPFAQLWDSTIKPADRALYGWEANPWVWVIEFERCERPKEVKDGVD